MTKKDITARIQQHAASFSKGQRRIADVILSTYDKVAYMTASKLGETCGVSESTVVRFATELGYSGYPEMQKAIRDLLRTRLTPNQRIAVSNSLPESADPLMGVLTADMVRIKGTLENLDRAAFDRAVEALCNAEQIYIFGSRSSATLAYFLSFNLELTAENIKLIAPSSASEVFEQIFSIHEGDVLFVISFPRYSKKAVDAAKYARAQGATVIALTDSSLSPLAPHADHLLIAESDMVSFVDSLVAPLSVLNAIMVAVAAQKQQEITARFDRLEKLWDEYGVYDKS